MIYYTIGINLADLDLSGLEEEPSPAFGGGEV